MAAILDLRIWSLWFSGPAASMAKSDLDLAFGGFDASDGAVDFGVEIEIGGRFETDNERVIDWFSIT